MLLLRVEVLTLARITMKFLCLLLIYTEINWVYGDAYIDYAGRTLSQLDQNITSSLVHAALIQIDDSIIGNKEDAIVDLKMAEGTVADLLAGLSKLDSADNPLCTESSCLIPDIERAQVALRNGDPTLANQTLTKVLHNIDQY
jgi:hypothetical protein